jgi:hypothetical protein
MAAPRGGAIRPLLHPEIIDFFGANVSSLHCNETILFCDETIFRFWSRQVETTVRYQIASTAAEHRPKAET